MTVAVVFGLTLGPATAQESGGPFRVIWRIYSTGELRPILQGHVYNDSGRYAAAVRLQVEELGSAGQGGSRETVYVAGGVPPGGRGYFETRVRSGASNYRVIVVGVDWMDGGGG
jgi:hypothetical protein